MSPLILALTLVGALAVVAFAIHLAIRFRRGAKVTAARATLTVSGIAAGVCAVLGVLIAFLEP